jgi:hypothetical protein
VNDAAHRAFGSDGYHRLALCTGEYDGCEGAAAYRYYYAGEAYDLCGYCHARKAQEDPDFGSVTARLIPAGDRLRGWSAQ